jgi:GT2 family glycosyltransferase
MGNNINLSKKIKISVIMVDGSFRERFQSVDFFCNQTLPSNEYEVIWVEYYDKVNRKLQEKQERYKNLRIITLNRNGEYHSSYCFNRGIVESGGEVLVIPDADVIVEKDFLEAVWQEHERCEKLVIYLYRYNEPKDQHIEPVTLDHLKSVCKLTNPTNFGGCLTVRKKWLLHINGYEQHSIFSSGFHANGADIASRLKALGLHVMWHPELKLYHPYHGYSSDSTFNYKMQHIVIDYRRKALHYLPFSGIEENRNLTMPDSLREEIELAIKNLKLKPDANSYLKQLFRRVFNIL